MRLIDADALIDEYYKNPTYPNLCNAINSAPTIDIVRCKECRWHKDFDGCFFSTAEVEEDGFCSYGERSD